jgi:hypothetical protein
MRTTIVPAQITTVEDKIAGNLNLTQIFLLLIPVFLGSIIYLIFPPRLHFALYKLPVMLFITLICCVLAIKIKGRVIVQWIVILYRYNNRPKYFIANKNDEYLRDLALDLQNQEPEAAKAPVIKKREQERETPITIPDVFKLEQFIASPKSNMSFKFAKKGKLYVSLSEIK